MNSKILLGIGIFAIGILVLPQTVALFAGQHNFYDTQATTGNDIPCEKCHADIISELSQPGYVNAVHKAQSPDNGCGGCHIITPIRVEGLKQGPGGQFHASAAPACIDCHGGSGPGLDAREIFTGSEEVHKPFYNESNSSKFLKGANEACIGCHTHVGVNITWSKATTLEFNATEQTLADGSHTWSITDFRATGTNITKTSG